MHYLISRVRSQMSRVIGDHRKEFKLPLTPLNWCEDADLYWALHQAPSTSKVCLIKWLVIGGQQWSCLAICPLILDRFYIGYKSANCLTVRRLIVCMREVWNAKKWWFVSASLHRPHSPRLKVKKYEFSNVCQLAKQLKFSTWSITLFMFPELVILWSSMWLSETWNVAPLVAAEC